MDAPAPLDVEEELLWRALTRLAIALPRDLDADLLQDTGLSLTEYGALMNLSEAPHRQLRMAELASATGMSASRITRVVDRLQKQELITKQRCDGDGRGFVAVLTELGLSRLREAYPSHLASARRRVFAHLAPSQIPAVGNALRSIVIAAERGQ
ncbi:MarR family winged helix-turn-helix transcriptional regulator [uncultured Jatrophihabitans sp.]|uniref:MarR family winged helix-turn-helix transcriptional regulator n=1 Tax=uncultured Jatrophihabitans sp. TaxID=1610747 RepID=UPI0035CC88EB